MDRYILLVTSPDQTGLVYTITSILYRRGLNIVKNDEYVDHEETKFFMRTEFSGTGEVEEERLVAELRAALPIHAEVVLHKKRKRRVVLFGTKESHCLGDILIRYDGGELEAEIIGVVSNYETLRPLVERFGIPYYALVHEGEERAAHEARILELLDSMQPELIVLAKYMRILSPAFVARYPGRILNIHHSFLPAFIGANPYKQAHERGVKIIGATAHFVNDHLDEGPIIAQEVLHIDHSYSWRDMQKVGRDVEKIVLAKALQLALEDRIFVHGNKTVIF